MAKTKYGRYVAGKDGKVRQVTEAPRYEAPVPAPPPDPAPEEIVVLLGSLVLEEEPKLYTGMYL